MKKIIFVVVNFNNYLYTSKLCKSLSLQKGSNHNFDMQCIVVNNSIDSDDTMLLEGIKKHYSWLTIIQANDNIGYFGGLNYGLKNINDRQKDSIVVIGNNDLEFEENFCLNLISSYDVWPKNIHAVSPSVITPEGINQNPYIKNRISAFKRFQFDVYFAHYYLAVILNFLRPLLLPKKIMGDNDSVPQEIHMGIGACYILTPSFFMHSSKLNCSVFLCGEEAFFSDQIRSNSGILYFDPSLKVLHAGSAALSLLSKRQIYEYARTGYPLYRNLM